jgi:hypothetical protein
MRISMAVLLSLVLFAGCRDDGNPPRAAQEVGGATPSAATTEAPTASVAPAVLNPPAVEAPAPTVKEDPAAVAAITEAEAAGVLIAWLDAQNKGDFDAYERLYAAKFFGVKRAGDRTYRLDREGWVKDRRRMFSKGLTVEARQPSFAVSQTVATVSFVQRFATGTFEDLGPKRLMLVREGAALRIAREEMLRSEVLKSRLKAAGEVANQSFAFVVRVGGDSYVVAGDPYLEEEGDEATSPWERQMMAHGAPTLVGIPKDLDSVVRTLATVEEADLPPSVRNWKGRAVRVDGACVAKVVGFTLIGEVTPHFGTALYWSTGDPNGVELGDPLSPRSAEEVADSAFGLSSVVIGAKLSRCHGTYARLASLPEMPRGTRLKDSALTSMATAAFTALDDVKRQEVERQQEEGPGGEPWWTGHVEVDLSTHPSSKRTFVSVHADNGGICGDFGASAWQLFELVEGALVTLHARHAPGKLLRTLDVNGDGVLDYLVEGVGFGEGAGLLNPLDGHLMSHDVAYHDCPC